MNRRKRVVDELKARQIKKGFCDDKMQQTKEYHESKQFNMKFFHNLVAENTDLFVIDQNKDEIYEYYSFIVSNYTSRWCKFTISGDVSFYKLLSLLFGNLDESTFCNVQNIFICDMKNNKPVINISKMLCIKNMLLKNWDISIKSIFKGNRYDMVFVHQNQFYLCNFEKILYINELKKDYFTIYKYNKNRNKCHLCKQKCHKHVLQDKFIFKEDFNQFCDRCYKIVNSRPAIP